MINWDKDEEDYGMKSFILINGLQVDVEELQSGKNVLSFF